MDIHVKRDRIEPDMAMDIKGNFVITWDSSDLDGSEYMIFTKKFKNEQIKLVTSQQTKRIREKEFRQVESKDTKALAFRE